jgi:hypothetical protein
MDYYMRATYPTGWTPQLLVMNVDGRLVGGAALKMRGVLGGRSATLLLPRNYGADFLVDPHHRDAFVRNALRFIFEKLRCQEIDLTMPSESPNLALLKEISKSLGLQDSNPPLRADLREHSVIEVKGTWDEFQKRRGINFVRRYKEIERLLRRAGRWRIRDIPLDGPEPVKIIRTIERNSWKDRWRRERGILSDPNLPAFFAYWKMRSADEGPFPRLHLLELNGEPIAYGITLELNRVGLCCKTSFDLRHAKLSPGEYVQNASIQKLYESGEVSEIDMLTGLSYIRRWSSLRRQRERIVITKTVPVLSSLVRTLEKSKYVRTSYKALRRVRGSPWKVGRNLPYEGPG